ncbi:tetratricopeptide repeat protein [Breznakiellaceae bacterium SP9]
MKKRITTAAAVFIAAALCVFAGCAGSAADAETSTAGTLSLEDAIEQSAKEVAQKLEPGARVVVMAVEAESAKFGEYVKEELAHALDKTSVEVVARSSIEYVQKELDIQYSGMVDDESMQGLGHWVGAEFVVIGKLDKISDTYRWLVRSVTVETDVQATSTRLTVRNDKALQNLIAAQDARKTVYTAAYGVTEKTVPKSVGTFLDRGILFAMRQDYEMAIMDFTDALKIDPELFAAYTLRGRAYFAGASKVFSVSENFSSVGTTTIQGRNATEEQRSKYDLAIADFTQAIRLDPSSVNTYYERGNAYCGKGDYDRAIADHTQAIRLDPNYASAFNSRGLVYADKGDYDRAIADYNQAIRLGPNYESAYANRGNAYFSKGDYDRAIADYTQAIRLDPNLATAFGNRGVAYRNKGDYDRAIADYNQAIKLDPNDVSAFYNRGLDYSDKGDYDRAIADYTQAIKLNPNLELAFDNRGIAYYYKGDYDRAIADYTQAIKLNPDYVLAFYNRGNAYSKKGDYDRAITDYNQAIKIDPNDAGAYSNRGNAYFDKGDYDRAIADYTQAIKIDPDYVWVFKFNPNYTSAFYNRGNAYFDKGDYDRAIADYTQTLKLNPNHANAKKRLEEARKKVR